MVIHANITSATRLTVAFTKITKQLHTPAFLIVAYKIDDGMNTLLRILLTVGIMLFGKGEITCGTGSPS